MRNRTEVANVYGGQLPRATLPCTLSVVPPKGKKPAKLPPPSAVGRNVRRFRQQLGLSQEALAKKAGVYRLTVTFLETGRTETVGSDTLQLLADALGVSTADLVRDESVPAITPIEPLLSEFLRSPLAGQLTPPISEEEIVWLRSLPGIVWAGSEPTLESIYFFVLGYRRLRAQGAKK